MLQRLLLWKELVLRHIQHAQPEPATAHVPLQFQPYMVDMPALFLNVQDFHHPFTPILSASTLRPTPYVQRHACRYIEMRDEQNTAFQYYLETVNSIDAVLEERLLGFQIFFHMLTDNTNQIHMRHLQMTLPAFVMISPTLRLVRTSPHEQLLEGVYRQGLGESYDEKQAEFALRLYFSDRQNRNIPAELEEWIGRVPPEKLLESICPSDLLSQYMYVMIGY